LVKPILEGIADVTIGARLEKRNEMPLSRRVMNSIANFITWIFFGIYVNDSQSGFRAYSRDALEKVLYLYG
jgi:UDP-N-acetylglucosamine---dolichyl-phosphate N-acetylglucosaminyltransferase